MSRLTQSTALFNEILRAGSGLGMSIGVLHRGEVVYTTHLGQQDVFSTDAPSNDTVYYIASLTKAITAAASAILVHEGSLEWERPIADYLPDFGQRSDELGQQMNLIDILSHRTGMTGCNAYWVQRKQNFMLPKQETVKLTTALKTTMPFRSGFQYNNWGYGLATEIIEKVSGRSYGAFVKERIFDPMGMTRTTIEVPHMTNVTSVNMVHDDGRPCPIKPPPNSDETGLAGAGGGKSSLIDLLNLYKVLMSSYKSSSTPETETSHGSPFRLVPDLFQERIGIGKSDMSKHGYTLGWVRSVLPQRLGTIGMNSMIVKPEDMPIIGESSPGTVVYHHHGNLIGALSSVHLIPSSETAIVVLSNTLGFTDTTDWVGQLILQMMLGEEPHDYLGLSALTKSTLLSQFDNLAKNLESQKTETKPSQSLTAYEGTYLNALGNFILEISVHASGTMLQMRVQRLDVVYDLFPYDGDTFYWPSNREEELCNQMMFPWTWTELHKITFHMTENGFVKGLSWKHDPLVDPELFSKHSAKAVPENHNQQPLEASL